jgi:hypothetical protein
MPFPLRQVLILIVPVNCAPMVSGALSGSGSVQNGAAAVKSHYVGSAACKSCHLAEYNGWKKSRMANILLNPRDHPEAVVGDFTRPDPVRTFTLDDVAFLYGGRFKQRYFSKRGDDYYPLPAQWDVAKRKWLPYHVEAGTDWWVPFHGPTSFVDPPGRPATAVTR